MSSELAIALEGRRQILELMASFNDVAGSIVSISRGVQRLEVAAKGMHVFGNNDVVASSF